MNDIPRDPLIHDLAIVLAGSLHPGAVIGPAPRLVARRMRDVLGIPEGAPVKDIEWRLREVLERPAGHDFSGWSPSRLAVHLEHLDRLLLNSAADPGDPMRAQLRADRAAVLEAQREAAR